MIDLTTLTDYAWADIAKAAKAAMVSAAMGGGTLTINGRTITRINIDQAKKLYQLALEMQAADAGGIDGTSVLVQFGNPQ